MLKPIENLPIVRSLVRKGTKLEDRYVGNAFVFNEHEVKTILNKKKLNICFKDITRPIYQKAEHLDSCAKMQYIDLNGWLTGDILLKADKMCMANSLEVRMPFLDKEVFKLAAQLPTEHKITVEQTKYAFRLAAEKTLLHDVSKKKKLGFPVPTREWLREKDVYLKIKGKFEKGGKFFNVDYIVKLLEEHYQGKRDNNYRIWSIYAFLIWHDQFFV
jgi:asparagine synthase (glutamine-hydrolysing)